MKVTCLKLLICVGLVSLGAQGRAEPRIPKRSELSKYRLFHDGRGNYLAYDAVSRWPPGDQQAKRNAELLEVGTNEARQIFKSVALKRNPWDREYLLLARDSMGTYYYVDESSQRKRSSDLHLYIGRRGKLKRMRLSNVVRDDSGILLVSKRGALRASGLAKKDASPVVEWGDPKKSMTKLIRVQGNNTQRFIYTDLGVYLGKKQWTPCDVY